MHQQQLSTAKFPKHALAESREYKYKVRRQTIFNVPLRYDSDLNQKNAASKIVSCPFKT